MKQPIQVTRPVLPDFDRFVKRIEGIWRRGHLTNHGPLVDDYERELARHLATERSVRCVANGALGLQLILKAMKIGGEVVTTPFSYVATSSCPAWEGCSVRFADIEPNHLTLDPEAVEASISPNTEAILATHVFGNPCDVDRLATIAEKHGLALIYDAAHAFGVRYRGRSIVDFGDASMISLHATKVVHSVEGGCIIAKDGEIDARVEWMRRFGHDGHDAFHGVGTNAKMSEFHAAMGLEVLAIRDDIFKHRSELTHRYFVGLSALSAHRFAFTCREGTEWNHSYLPVLCLSEQHTLDSISALRHAGIEPRRYFHPSLDEAFPELTGGSSTICPVSRDISARIICLPLSADLETEAVELVLETLAQVPC